MELNACRSRLSAKVSKPLESGHTEDRLSLMSNTSKLAVLSSGDGLETLRQVNNLVEMAHDNYYHKVRYTSGHEHDMDNEPLRESPNPSKSRSPWLPIL